jgi:hypothetical protein
LWTSQTQCLCGFASFKEEVYTVKEEVYTVKEEVYTVLKRRFTQLKEHVDNCSFTVYITVEVTKYARCQYISYSL